MGALAGLDWCRIGSRISHLSLLLLSLLQPGPTLLACHHFSNGTDRACSTSQSKHRQGNSMGEQKICLRLHSLTSACTAEFAAAWGNKSRHLSLFISSTKVDFFFSLYLLGCWSCKISTRNGNISKLLNYPLRVLGLFRSHS